MRRLFLFLLLSSFVVAQTPQSPRQALLEMIKATRTELRILNRFDKHTPDVMLQAMATLPPEARQKQHQSMMALSMIMAISPNFLQLFETGPTFAVIQDPKDKTKVEITMERDDLTGDTDVMEMGIRVYKEDKLQELPFDPRVLIDMKLEKNVWKLGKIGFSAAIQLDDPKVAALLVKSMQEQMAKVPAVSATNPGAPRTMSEMNIGMKKGEIFDGPRSRYVSCCCSIVASPPMPLPTITPRRLGS